MIKTFFGGGSGWAMALLVTVALGFGGGLYLEYKDAIKDKEKAEQQLTTERATSNTLRIALDSHVKTAARKAADGQQNQEDEDAIKNTQDSDFCSRSEPVVVALGRVRDEWERRYAEPDNDE